MPTEIIPGIFQIKVPIPNNPLGNTNVYLVKGRTKHTLIDTGWNIDSAMLALTSELENIGVGFKNINQIVLTHAHPDHYGLVGRIKALTDAKVFLQRAENEILLTRYNISDERVRLMEEWFRLNGVPENEAPIIIPPGFRAGIVPPLPDVFLDGDETISTGLLNLKVIWTPGHSPGHICLYETQNKILFSGDHILPNITPNIGILPGTNGNPLGDFILSLKRLRQMDVKMVLPAHENIFYDLPERIDEIMKHHEARKAEILTALGSKTRTAYQLSGEITWLPERGGVKFQNLKPIDKRFAISETLAHLRALEADKLVTGTRNNGIFYYQQT